MRYVFLCFFFFTASQAFLFAQESEKHPLRIAVAANAREALEEIAALYEDETGQKIDFISGASGQLAVQIQNGAPYDLFFSADYAYAEMLVKAGKTRGMARHYATGSLVLWSRTEVKTKSIAQLLAEASKIAIPDARFAPYGKAVECYLKEHELWDKHKGKFVYANSISQVNRFIGTGAVSLGFTARAAVQGEKTVLKMNYQPLPHCDEISLAQYAVEIKHGKINSSAASFLHFTLENPRAQALWKKYGYSIPYATSR